MKYNLKYIILQYINNNTFVSKWNQQRKKIILNKNKNIYDHYIAPK